jgi:SH3-like domain-containing protein
MPDETQSVRLHAIRWAAVAVLFGSLATVLGAPMLAWADEALAKGASGLPLPRFVSLKSDRVNVRQGPTRDHAVAWIFTRQGLPVEILAEFDNWRRVRDSEGAEGWVFHSLLSGRRTVLVAPWAKGALFDLHRRASLESPVVARLEPGVLAEVSGCEDGWCRVKVKGAAAGFIGQDSLWGVYPNEEEVD